MKRKNLLALLIVVGFGFVAAFAGENKRLVEWQKDSWVLRAGKSEAKKIESTGSKLDCEEGIYFVYDNATKKKYLVDKNGYMLSEKQFMHVGHFCEGKTVVSGYLEEKYETDRIYNILTDEVSEPIPNMWIYCGYVNGLAAFSLRNSEGILKSVLVDFDLKNVVDIEFDEFYELNEDGIWHFVKDKKDYYINKDGMLIQ